MAFLTASLLLLSCFSSSSASCNGIADYIANSGYVVGDSVACGGSVYECRVPSWCNGDASLFSPCGATAWLDNEALTPCDGGVWQTAWVLLGDCASTTSTTSTTSTSTSTTTMPPSSSTSTSTSTTSTTSTSTTSSTPPPTTTTTTTTSTAPPTATTTTSTTTTSSTTTTTTSSSTTSSTASAGRAVSDAISVLSSASADMNSQLFIYETPQGQWEESTVYRFDAFLAGLKVMNAEGVNGRKYYLGSDFDGSADEDNGYKYGLANVAAFLAQSMKETIRYNACDENSWDLVGGKYPLSNACGQLGQSYQDYTCGAGEEHMQCEVDPTLQLKATTNAKWYGAPQPLFCGPKSVTGDTGYWDYSAECNKPWANPPETCDAYEGQLAGKVQQVSGGYANNAGRTDVEGCCYWGRGVIQTTGICNFGKLNYFLGKKAFERQGYASYPTVDFCKRPDKICSDPQFPELKWIAGYFYWVESLQSYNTAQWNYLSELKRWVSQGMQLGDTSFIDAVSGVVNRGCPQLSCPAGAVDGVQDRRDNFAKVINLLKNYFVN